MLNDKFLRIAIKTPLNKLFDYLPPQDPPSLLIPGSRVRVPFRNKTAVGILIEVVEKTDVPATKLKRAIEILDERSLFNIDIFQMCTFAANYYHYALGEILFAALPERLRLGKTLKPIPSQQIQVQLEKIPQLLSEAQSHALSTISASLNAFKVFLLDGVTGSGKTEVYLQLIEAVILQQRQVLVLVPEISLTPQTIARFRKRFAFPIAALNSSYTEKDRLITWQMAKTGEARVVIGTRSAIFTPFKNLGAIIVDEEHDASFKQQERFRYHARDLAILRAQINKIPIVLGSATPSLESILNVKRNRYVSLILPERAGNAQLPDFEIIDLKKTISDAGLSAPFLDAMRAALDNNQQVLLFLNRRGFSPVLYCATCFWIAGCKRCDARLVYHKKPTHLRCHHCDAKRAIPKYCEQCQSTDLAPVGSGTQRIEEILKEIFTATPIIRIDRDSTQRTGSLENLLNKINNEPRAILVGTQMLAKGHHFPNVTLVGILDIDHGLLSADYRAVEQMGQLLIQVAGRAGREKMLGKVIIQTRHPEHPLLQLLIRDGYKTFASLLLQERHEAELPPYSYLALLRAHAYDEQKALDFLTDVVKHSEVEDIKILGPVSAILSKRKGLYSKHLCFKAARRNTLQQFLEQTYPTIEALAKKFPVKWSLDIDPIEI